MSAPEREPRPFPVPAAAQWRTRVVRNTSVSKPAAILTAPALAPTTESALGRRFHPFRMVARPAQLVLYVSREGRERTMETLLIIVVLLFLFGGGGYYWNSRRG
jgi:hypothetical protein